MKNILIQLGKALCYYISFLGMQFVVAFGMMFLYILKETMVAMTGGDYNMDTIVNGAAQYLVDNANLMAAISGILTIVTLWIFFLIRKKKLSQETGMEKIPGTYFSYAVVLGISLAVAISFGMSLLPESWIEAYAQEADLMVGDSVLLMVISTMVVAPLVEEIVFRGLMLSRLRKAMPVGWAVAVSSLLFGLAHGQILWIAYAAILGVIMSVVVVKTKSLTTSIILHMTFNIFGTVVPTFFGEVTSTIVVVAVTAIAVAVSAVVLVKLLNTEVPEGM